MIDKKYLKTGKDASGEDIWVCEHCHKPADHAQGAQNNPDQLVHMLMCPAGKITLGEWATLKEKKAQLAAYMAELKKQQE